MSEKLEIDHLAAQHANELASVLTNGLLNNNYATKRLLGFPLEKNTRIPRVRSRLAHAEALLIGRGAIRCLGSKQIQALYGSTDVKSSDVKATHLNLNWIGSRAYAPNAVVLDDHNNHTPGLNFASVASVASRRAIAAAHILGYSKFVVEDYPFTEFCLTQVALEESVERNLDGYKVAAKRRYKGLLRLMRETPESLDKHYQSVADSLTFYRRVEIPTFDNNGEPAWYLGELEAINAHEGFTPLDLSDGVREEFGILPHEEPLSATWGYDGMAQEFNGKKLYFGGIICQIDPPAPCDGIWVRQDEMARVRAQMLEGAPELMAVPA